jgi:phenylpyruvate tautomerase PptA (4-oxalocrotonate tautomerase family)
MDLRNTKNRKDKDALLGRNITVTEVVHNAPSKYSQEATVYVFKENDQEYYFYGGSVLDKQNIQAGMTIRLKRKVNRLGMTYFVAESLQVEAN